MPLISETCDTSKLERSRLVRLLIPENILDISVTLLVIKCDKSSVSMPEAPLNIPDIVSTDEVSKLTRLRFVRLVEYENM